jgi:hypothetical protein
VCPVDVDQTCPIAFRALWELSGNDLTWLGSTFGEGTGAFGRSMVAARARLTGRGVGASGRLLRASGRDLTRVQENLAVEIQRCSFEGRDAWRASIDQTLA